MTEWESLTDEFKAQLKAVTGRRARVVIDHILEHGHITTEELKDTYGYNHPPRAARDVREQGVPLETFKVTGSDGRRIGAYRFDLDSVVDASKTRRSQDLVQKHKGRTDQDAGIKMHHLFW